jgi:hypothetical protein
MVHQGIDAIGWGMITLHAENFSTPPVKFSQDSAK